ncbi:MAG: AAA family ATPase, partial [Anaerolineales bacterium]
MNADQLLDVQTFAEKVIKNIEKVIVGKREAVELAVIGLLSQGHLLIEDVPGVGKTMLARILAKSIGCDFSRIQFTPDMLPSDVTGVTIYNQASQTFEYRAGPIVAQVVLADEINRATPKTQSALLEAMEERQITVDGVTHILPQPFMVLATQNPIEYEGTFRLPEAQ